MTTLSSLIVSPRANVAFYDGIENSSLEEFRDNSICLTPGKVKVIYPFYQYGEYDEYAPESADYYLPGSSIKGALHQKPSAPGSLLVDDVSVPNDRIVLRNLYKAQHLKNLDEPSACFDVFFENVGIEMIRSDSELRGEFYLNGPTAKTIIKTANELSKVKIGRMLKYLHELEEKNYKKTLRDEFHKVGENLFPLLDNNNVLLLGGYKGLIHSIEGESFLQEFHKAVFVDQETMLPHGLVEIELNQP